MLNNFIYRQKEPPPKKQNKISTMKAMARYLKLA